MKPEKVGEINDVVISVLNLSLDPDTPIFLGETNLEHMKSEHPEDFEKYSGKLAEILEFPDYVAKHPKKDSIEYVKKFYDEEKEDYVLVAVRASRIGIYYARTLFVMGDEKVKKYRNKNALIEIKKP
ncbi:PBECR2 nuclease fold domain-containing protein [Sinorhizobium meliloti]|uniref:PBECR3 domain-containing polyvalent protein n=1 Tax=Rhizobium meliloti TaxID=382 RepID=UPI000FD95EF0|nr:PBECR2 nuclease fold domain-containing protein [Sinorhizobium meliloti]RVP92910.1 transposase [Sinorhizobium meliloti]